jgi:hypothetical protein
LEREISRLKANQATSLIDLEAPSSPLSNNTRLALNGSTTEELQPFAWRRYAVAAESEDRL